MELQTDEHILRNLNSDVELYNKSYKHESFDDLKFVKPIHEYEHRFNKEVDLLKDAMVHTEGVGDFFTRIVFGSKGLFKRMNNQRAKSLKYLTETLEVLEDGELNLSKTTREQITKSFGMYLFLTDNKSDGKGFINMFEKLRDFNHIRYAKIIEGVILGRVDSLKGIEKDLHFENLFESKLKSLKGGLAKHIALSNRGVLKSVFLGMKSKPILSKQILSIDGIGLTALFITMDKERLRSHLVHDTLNSDVVNNLNVHKDASFTAEDIFRAGKNLIKYQTSAHSSLKAMFALVNASERESKALESVDIDVKQDNHKFSKAVIPNLLKGLLRNYREDITLIKRFQKIIDLLTEDDDEDDIFDKLGYAEDITNVLFANDDSDIKSIDISKSIYDSGYIVTENDLKVDSEHTFDFDNFTNQDLMDVLELPDYDLLSMEVETEEDIKERYKYLNELNYLIKTEYDETFKYNDFLPLEFNIRNLGVRQEGVVDDFWTWVKSIWAAIFGSKEEESDKAEKSKRKKAISIKKRILKFEESKKYNKIKAADDKQIKKATLTLNPIGMILTGNKHVSNKAIGEIIKLYNGFKESPSLFKMEAILLNKAGVQKFTMRETNGLNIINNNMNTYFKSNNDLSFIKDNSKFIVSADVITMSNRTITMLLVLRTKDGKSLYPKSIRLVVNGDYVKTMTVAPQPLSPDVLGEYIRSIENSLINDTTRLTDMLTSLDELIIRKDDSNKQLKTYIKEFGKLDKDILKSSEELFTVLLDLTELYRDEI